MSSLSYCKRRVSQVGQMVLLVAALTFLIWNVAAVAEDSCPTTTPKPTEEADKGFKCNPQTKIWGPWTKTGTSGSTINDPCEGVTTDITVTTTYTLKSQTLITEGPNEGSYEVYWTKTVTTTTTKTPGGTTTVPDPPVDEGPYIYTPECCECEDSCSL